MHSDTHNVVIEVTGLSKTYPASQKPLQHIARLLFNRPDNPKQGFQALKPLSFTLNKGETLGVIGRNGAGKSTLLQMICGTLKPSSGQVKVQGKVAALLELGAGFNPEFSGRENIFISASVYGFSREQTLQRLDDIIEFAQIGEHIDQPVKTYSSGMFVRLAFAVIAHVDAEILIIDEALSVGDIYFSQKCMRFLQEFAERGTLLFVSHDTSSVNRLCQRALWIDQGELKMLGAAKAVVDAYLGSFYEDQSIAVTAETPPTPAAATESPAAPATPFRHSLNPRNNFASTFGTGQGQVLACRLLDASGNEVLLQDTAGTFQLLVDVQAHQTIEQPIVGFYIKDRLGQPVCGHNTLSLLPNWSSLPADTTEQVSFEFQLPQLATGDYTITVSLAAGTQVDHVQHHWVHDILTFKAAADPHLLGLFVLDSITASTVSATRLSEDTHTNV